jgi:hypothetical protein
MRVDVDKASAEKLKVALGDVLSNENRKELFDTIGTIVKIEAQEKAIAYGGRNFWRNEIADSISYETNDSGVEIGSADWRSPHVQFGGAISAPGKGEGTKNRRFLTIPASKEAYGKSVSDFDNRETFLTSKNKFFESGVIWLKGTGKNGQGKKPLFWLVKKTKPQRKRPFMPWGKEVEQLVGDAIEAWTDSKANKGG